MGERKREREKQICSARIKTNIACSCWGWENVLHLMLGAVCDSREPGAASKRLWEIKGQGVEGGSRAGMPEMR